MEVTIQGQSGVTVKFTDVGAKLYVLSLHRQNGECIMKVGGITKEDIKRLGKAS